MSVTLAQGSDEKVDFFAQLVDLRKRGFVPVSGELQSSGVVHHMQLAGRVDPASCVLERIAANQPSVAFEPSEMSEGECCRDPIDRIHGLEGLPLGRDFLRPLAKAIGGARGCSHILTLFRLVAATVPHGIAWEGERAPTSTDRHAHPARSPGDRIFRRDLILDGNELPDRKVQIATQLTDLLLAPAPAIRHPMDRFERESEVRSLATMDVARYRIIEVVAGERHRSLANLEEAAWRDRSDAVGELGGLLLGVGVSQKLRERIGEAPENRQLLDALMHLTPTFHQCVGALSEGWPAEARRRPTYLGTSGPPDSCYMWRSGGAFDRYRKKDEAASSN